MLYCKRPPLVLVVLICAACMLAPALVNAAQTQSNVQKPYDIKIYTFTTGSWAYIMGVALAQFINKDSKWLRATAVEATAPAVSLKMLAARPDLRKNTLVHANISNMFDGKHGLDVFKGMPPINEFRSVALIGASALFLTTCDRNLKTLKDLTGKRVAVGASGITLFDLPMRLLEIGGAQNVRYSKSAAVLKDGVDWLRDSIVDAAITSGFGADESGSKCIPTPGLFELLQVKETNFISFDQSQFAATMKNFPNYPIRFATFKPGAISTKQTYPLTVWASYPLWMCHMEMPDEVVHEILTVYAHNVDKFKEFNPVGNLISSRTMGLLGNEDSYHPAALKFFKEKGIRTGWFTF